MNERKPRMVMSEEKQLPSLLLGTMLGYSQIIHRGVTFLVSCHVNPSYSWCSGLIAGN